MKLLKSSILSLMIVMMGGCNYFTDDTEGCPATFNVSLSFRFKASDSQGNFVKLVDDAELIVFDDKGYFVLRQPVTKAELTQFEGVRINLHPGKYRIVCWANISGKYSIADMNGQTPFASSNLEHIDRPAGRTDNGNRLYYAPKITNFTDPDSDAFNIEVPRYGKIVKELTFSAAHKTIEIYAKGFNEGTRANVGLPVMEVTGLCCGYNFNMQTISDNPICYEQRSAIVTKEGEEMSVASFYTPLFKNDNPSYINIKHPTSGTVMEIICLKDFLSQNGISLTEGGHDKIEILLEYSEGRVTVSLPNWNTEDVDPEL